MSENLTREMLFALVWERPMVEVAKELGISDVALAKRCRNLQVPTPPRGYWAKLRSGQKIRKPPLKEFVAELARKRAKKPKGHVDLSEGQWDFLDRALGVLAREGVDTSGCHYPKYEIRSIDPELAADVIVRVQRHYSQWAGPNPSSRKLQGAQQCAGHLIAKLVPVAKAHVLVVREDEGRSYGSQENAIYVRVTLALLKEISVLLKIVRANRLEYVAKPLRTVAHAWRPRYLSSPDGRVADVGQMLISDGSLWFKTEFLGYGDRTVEVATEKIELSAIMPEELLVPEFFEISEDQVVRLLDEYRDRIKAIAAAENLYQSISDSIHWGESDAPSATIALMERLWFGRGDDGLLAQQAARFKEMEETLEEWERMIDDEKSQLVREILGVGAGDDVSFVRQGKKIRMRVRYASVDAYDDKLIFYLVGVKYRKDGQVGKVDDRLHLSVPG